ncbi:TonB-dependent receptor domain-containing protein [Acidomonas methanolica]|uniref:TonB-dependent receptor domain-containing protein n=1 Tax=Acidomonas methanolica TaxID=437 RepID=UPI00211A9FBC|nr:TonB-dependent receptor [Acidomonas methanolica]MCQ9157231.1 TonB-dependent receptor [Acidomonas methanolica]
MKKNVGRASLFLGVATNCGLALSWASQPADAATQTMSDAKSAHHMPAKHQGVVSGVSATSPASINATPAPSARGASHVPSPPRSTQATTLNAGASKPSGTTEENITVVGSRLIRNSIDEIQPITSVSGAQIQRRGYTNVGTALLTENPSFTVGANTPIGTQGPQAGQTFLNLFNMGSQRTLTLVDGFRFVSGASASLYGSVSGDAVDVTEIPDGLIDKISTAGTGGAPIYGADAIAGTVNMQLKQNIEGLHINGQAGWSQKLDALNDKVEVYGGHNFDHDRGNITVDVEYTKQYGLAGSDRYYAGANSPWLEPVSGKPYHYELSNSQRYLLFTTAGIPLTSDNIPFQGGNLAGITNAAGQTLSFSPNGKSFVPLVYNSLSATGYTASGGNGFPLGNYSNLMTNTGRVSLTMLGHYDITPRIKVYGEAWYNRYNSTNVVGQPYYSTANFASAGQPEGNLIFNTSNPYLTTAERNTIVNGLAAAGQPTDQFLLTRASTDYYTGRYLTANEMFRVVGGFKGDFDLFGHTIYFDTNANYGSNTSNTYQNQINNQNFANALDAVQTPDGITCAPGYTNSPIATQSSVCSPLNVFGANNASKSAIRYITTPGSVATANTQLDVNLTAHTHVVHLPAGSVDLLVGYEHRREFFDYQPDAFNEGVIQNGACVEQYGYATCTPPTSGSYYTHEGFAETTIPLVSPSMHVPLVYHLFASSSARYTYNNRTGGFWSYTGGATWSPFRDLTFRGNYTRSLRAPGTAELFAPQSTDFEIGNDPCDTNFINGGPNPAIRAANCARAGVPAGFQSNITNFSATGTAGGNPHLKNEVGTSVSAGLTLQPHFIPGLSIQADYIDIRLTSAIQSPGVQYIMDACYDSANYPNNPYCSLMTRDPTSHQITDFNDSFQNIGGLESRVGQFVLDYFLPLRRIGLSETAGSLDLHATELHYFYSEQNIGGSVQQIYGTSTTPKDNMTANLTYTRGPLSFQWQTQWYGKSQISVQNPLSYYQYPFYHQYFQFNTNISYEFSGKYTLFFNVNNIANAHPAFPYVGSQNRYYDAILGRSFLFGFRADVL